MCGYGKVSAAVQMPILSYMGHDVFNLPTMLISNTFPYGKYAVMESTSYMKDAMQKWDELGIHLMPSPQASLPLRSKPRWWRITVVNRQSRGRRYLWTQ